MIWHKIRQRDEDKNIHFINNLEHQLQELDVSFRGKIFTKKQIKFIKKRYEEFGLILEISTNIVNDKIPKCMICNNPGIMFKEIEAKYPEDYTNMIKDTCNGHRTQLQNMYEKIFCFTCF